MIECAPCVINYRRRFLMKKLIFLILMFSSFLAVACGDNSIQSVGGPVSDGQGSVQTNSGLSASFTGDASINCDEPEEQGKITVYGYAPNFGGFGGIAGISFALSLTGGGGYIGTTTDDISCSNPDANWANNAFKKYRSKYISDHGHIQYQSDHPTNTLWTIELPSGQTATYKIVSPLGGVALGGAPVSCS